jgi:predicted kinase
MGESNPKIAIIMRGLPGSGKSTFVELVASNIGDCVVHAVDDLHLDSSGRFQWQEDDAERNYELNYANFVRSCADGRDVVVCDCMNLTHDDVQRYVRIAEQFGYAAYVITPAPVTATASARRNHHGVSLAHARLMLAAWEEWPAQATIEKLSKE